MANPNPMATPSIRKLRKKSVSIFYLSIGISYIPKKCMDFVKHMGPIHISELPQDQRWQLAGIDS